MRGLRPIPCRDFGFESRRWHHGLSRMSVVLSGLCDRPIPRPSSPTDCGVSTWMWFGKHQLEESSAHEGCWVMDKNHYDEVHVSNDVSWARSTLSIWRSLRFAHKLYWIVYRLADVPLSSASIAATQHSRPPAQSNLSKHIMKSN